MSYILHNYMFKSTDKHILAKRFTFTFWLDEPNEERFETRLHVGLFSVWAF